MQAVRKSEASAADTAHAAAPSVVHVGLGPVGRSIAAELLRRGGYHLVGGVDLDPAKVGRDLGALIGLEDELGLTVRSDGEALLAEASPDLVVLATASSLEAITPQIEAIVRHGASVVSTCEELSFPWRTRPDLARRLDAAAKAAGVAVLATGVNPGFATDFLPSVVTALCRDVRGVRVERFFDAGARRVEFQKKVGAGLSLEDFEKEAQKGTLRHVGIRESIDMIATALGWELSSVEESLEPVVAEQAVSAHGIQVEAGRARGVLQVGRGRVDQDERITFTFQATVGQEAPRDRVLVEGEPPVELTLAGIHGDLATCNVVVGSIPSLLAAPPGLRTMLDILSPRGNGV